MKKISRLLFFLILLSGISQAQEKPDFLKHNKDQWVDSLMIKMTLDQKIGQLFMIQAYSNKNDQHVEELIQLVRNYGIGGVIFMQGSPVAQLKMTNELQQSSSIPLLIAIDAENGLGFRLDSTLNYPIQMALGAITNDTLIYRMGFEIGEQCRLLGIHMNMAPVSDINMNPANPVINYRSFGEDRMQVARKSWLYASGMQDAGVLATAKHFPGHGDTGADSHYDLPEIAHTRSQLDSLGLFPFSYLINKGIGAIMTSHLQVPALEPDGRIPATISEEIINKKLKKDLGFNGLVITDAMNMRGISNLYSSAESSVRALKAGNDMVEIVPRLDRAISAVKLAVQNGELSADEINEKCRKVLTVKKWLGLDQQKQVETKNLNQKLNGNHYQLTKRLLHEQSLTVLINQLNTIPLQRLDTLKLASLMIGSAELTPYQKMLENYSKIDHFNISKTPSEEEINRLLNQLHPYKLVIIGINGMGLYPFRRFGITDQQIELIEKLKGRNTIISYFGNPYSLPNFPSITNTKSLIIAYQDDSIAQEMAAQLIFGATDATGKLPVTVKDMFPINSGMETKSIHRLKYTLPEEVNISSDFLNFKLDSLAASGINRKAFPGCQVLVAKNGKVIFHKSYGYFTYEKVQAVQNNNLYDLASVTKITASLPVIMKLYDEKKINLDKPFATYFNEFLNTNKSEMTFRDVLTHQSRLQSFIPFWLEPGSNSNLRNGVFRNQPSEKFQLRISDKWYVRSDFKNQIIADIIKSPLRAHKEFHYSDLGFSLFPFITERLTGTSFQEYLNKEFFNSLGAVSTGFKPYERFPITEIVPTEIDLAFRKELLQGYVHDELAALLGGISGNAGLFSTANDLAKVMQMYLQLGYYGGKQYIKPETIREFTKVQFPLTENRRALGFDKPNKRTNGQNRFPASDASYESYGHTGFTGTFTWADPENQLLFIFLSNRVHPTRRITTINDLNIRTKMHQAIYDAIHLGVQ
ncbi:MAG TPA: serine hydrolase [Prolixibacteraceae bacterium]|nr:serine hydrolase [Prolixibacteraceae bacterium]